MASSGSATQHPRPGTTAGTARLPALTPERSHPPRHHLPPEARGVCTRLPAYLGSSPTRRGAHRATPPAALSPRKAPLPSCSLCSPVPDTVCPGAAQGQPGWRPPGPDGAAVQSRPGRAAAPAAQRRPAAAAAPAPPEHPGVAGEGTEPWPAPAPPPEGPQVPFMPQRGVACSEVMRSWRCQGTSLLSLPPWLVL